MKKYIKHFITIAKHKWLVMILCFKCGYYKRGLLHDLSKFGPTEFFSSAKYFQGNRSPIDAEKEDHGYSIAWQHHKGHNPHHWEYWIDDIGTKQNTPLPIPREYIVEMICDWIAAGIIYSGNKCDFRIPYVETYTYYMKHRPERIFEKGTQSEIEWYLLFLAEHGVNSFCRAARALRGVKD